MDKQSGNLDTADRVAIAFRELGDHTTAFAKVGRLCARLGRKAASALRQLRRLQQRAAY